MDFGELLAKADSNARKLNKKVKEANREIEHEKRKNLERLAIQKRIEKEDLKRKAPPRPPSPEQPKFVIPKKNAQVVPEVDKNKIAAFKQRQEREKQEQQAQKQREKEELIKLRIESFGGKANKKISKHFGKSPIELQMRYAHNPQHEETLRRQAEREQEEHDRLSALYRQGVYKAMNKKDDVLATHKPKVDPNRTASKLQHQSKQPVQKFVDPEGSRLPKSSGSSSIANGHMSKNSNERPSSSRNALPVVKKRKAPIPAETADFQTLMQKAQQNRDVDPDEFEFAVPEPRPVEKKPKAAAESVGVTAGRSLAYASKRSIREEPPKVKRPSERSEDVVRRESNNFSDGRTGMNERSSKATASTSKNLKSLKLNDSQKSFAANHRDGAKSSIPPKNVPKVKAERIIVDPELGAMKEKRYLPGDIRSSNGFSSQNMPQKRYLPGDVRFAGNATSGALPKQPQRSLPLAGSSKQMHIEDQRRHSTSSKYSSTASFSKANGARRSRDRGDDMMTASTSSATRNKYDEIDREKSELERRRRELMEMEAEFERKRLAEEQRRKGEANRLAAKSKQEQRMRFEMNQRYQNSRPKKERSRSPAIRYANYSETDEEEEEEDGVDDEYDSEMDDFIDDSVVDDLQREDFEESLRMINPRYDKKKWMMREKMIDDRRMDARFRDVEEEERKSAKVGLYEDFCEARRGSKALG